MRGFGVLLSALLVGGCATSATAPRVRPLPPPMSWQTGSAQLPAAPQGEADEPAAGARANDDNLVAFPPLAEPDPIEAAAIAAESDAPSQPATAGEETQEQLAADDEIDDDAEAPTDRPPEVSRAAPAPARSPLLELSDAELTKRIAADLDSLGSLSVGSANSGALVNAVRLESDDHWEVIDVAHAWGTRETIDYLRAATHAVYAAYPDSAKLRIGHLSSKRGGKLAAHKSHQSGRDVDVSYYYDASQTFHWYRPVTAENLDRARTWTFVRALLTETDVEWIFINSSVQKLLKEYALSIGEDAEWLDSVFQYGSRKPWTIIRHARGHDTHIHVRFYNPVAQELGRRSYGALVASGRIQPPTYYQRHLVKKGEILSRIARRYGVSVTDIQKANKLRSTLIRAGQVYLIPKKGQVAPASKLVVPPRRLPPEDSASASRRVAAPHGG